jgi:hypothetical protein
MYYGNTQNLLGEYGEAYSEYRTMEIKLSLSLRIFYNKKIRSLDQLYKSVVAAESPSNATALQRRSYLCFPRN